MIALVPLTAERVRRIAGGDLTGLEHADAGRRSRSASGSPRSARDAGTTPTLVRVLAATLLDDPRVTTVVAHTLPENTASRRVLEKAGFAVDSEQDGLVRYVRRA